MFAILMGRKCMVLVSWTERYKAHRDAVFVILMGRMWIVLLNWAKTWRSHRTSNMHEAQTENLPITQKPSYYRYKIALQALQHICFTLSYVTSCSQWLIFTLSFTLDTHLLRQTVPICARHLVYCNDMSGLVFEISERNMPPPPPPPPPPPKKNFCPKKKK